MSLDYRMGTLADIRASTSELARSVADLERRAGVPDAENRWNDATFVEDYWEQRRSLFEHLARAAEYFVVAESDRGIVGYARSTLQDGVRELTEFFVAPSSQASGIGRELLSRAFPPHGARRRIIIATADLPALARYLRTGLSPRFPMYPFSGTPKPLDIESDLTVDPMEPGSDTVAALRKIDRAVLGFARDEDHSFLQQDRQGVFYRRDGHIVGYGYAGNGTGPIALIDPSDFPAVLSHIETGAAERQEASIRLTVPLVNRDAVEHLLGRGFRLEAFPMYLMSDEPFGDFERYIGMSPPLFL